MEKEVPQKKKSIFKKIWDFFLVILGVLSFMVLFAFFQVYEETKPKTDETKPSVKIEKLKKEVDTLYQKKSRTTDEINALYSKIRKEEGGLLEKAKANDEKALLKSEIVSLKQDVMMLQTYPEFKPEPKPDKKKK